MIFDAWLFQDQLLEVVDLANAVPDVVIIINHLGGPRGTGRC
jgi:L-fuconolactonase